MGKSTINGPFSIATSQIGHQTKKESQNRLPTARVVGGSDSEPGVETGESTTTRGNHGENMGKHGENMGKPWGNHGKDHGRCFGR